MSSIQNLNINIQDKIEYIKNLDDVFKRVESISKEELVVITGSVFLVADILQHYSS